MDFRLPDLGEGIHEAELVEWQVKRGDHVSRGDDLAEVMTDKAAIDLPSPFSGTIVELLVEPGTTVQVDERLLTYSAIDAAQTGEAPDDASAVTTATQPPLVTTDRDQTKAVPVPSSDPRRAAAPAVRRLADRLSIDLTAVTGSGPDGRILIDDVADVILARQSRAGAPGEETESRIPFRGMRRRIAERMIQAKRTIPHYSYVDECDVTRMVRARERLRDSQASDGVRITFLPFFVRAVALALREVPLVNSSLDDMAEEIVLHNRVHIGIAAATSDGLIVPVLRDADQMTLTETALEITRLSADAKNGRTRREDLAGSTFTITSIGGIGGLISTPIINVPEVGILGIGRIVKRPVWIDADNSAQAAEMVYLSFSFDHRVIDGAVGAEFGNAVIRHLQEADAWLPNAT